MNLDSIDHIAGALADPGLTVRLLHQLWEQRVPVPEPAGGARKLDPSAARQVPWLHDRTLARQFLRRAVEKEEYLLVCDAAREARRLWPAADLTDPRAAHDLLHLHLDYATALTRLGSTRNARRELERWTTPAHAACLSRADRMAVQQQLGDILREESQHVSSQAAQVHAAEQALGHYRQALALGRERQGLEVGNTDSDAILRDLVTALTRVAALEHLLGGERSPQREQARRAAAEVLERATDLDSRLGPAPQTARSRAVAHVVLGNLDEAHACYRSMGTLPGVRIAELAEARYYARYLARAAGRSPDYFNEAFPQLQLVVFAGHLPNLPGEQPRLPPEAFDETRRRIRAALDRHDVRVGLLSASAGADLLFADELLDRGGTVHLVLPWSAQEFVERSVRRYEPSGRPPQWEPIFRRVSAAAATLRELGQMYEPGNEVGWQYTMEVTAGLALHAARVSRLDVQPMVLWDGRPARGAGSIASFVEFWTDHLARPPLVIEPAPVAVPPAGPARPAGSRQRTDDRCERSTLQLVVKSMLFADIVGYSKLREHVLPQFVELFLGRVSELAAQTPHRPRSINTWGDAVYAIFDYAHDAGCFALQLIRMIRESEPDWLRHELFWEDAAAPVRQPLNIRIGLHTGPVFMHYDPVVRRLGFTGAHVNRAARIEPVAQAGEAFASEEFAALSELSAEITRLALPPAADPDAAEDEGFVCEYAGSMPLAKNYPGRFRIYRLLPRRVLPIETLARAIHEAYCSESRARGETPGVNVALQAWEELPEDLRNANRAQAADIPNKLWMLGYELAPSWGLKASSIALPGDLVETMAIREHDRWMHDRVRSGWTYGPVRDNANKVHPLLVPWDHLSEVEKQKDRDTVRNVPMLVDLAGFRVRRLPESM